MPYTKEQFFDLLQNYNLAVWPMQGFLNLLAVFAVVLVFWKIRNSDRIISSILFGFWSWMGLAYHFRFYADINKAAYLFGSLFLVQGLLFFLYGVFWKNLSFHFPNGVCGYGGGLLILYALFLYPALGRLQGHFYPETDSFGLPSPTTLFTLGMLFLTKGKTHWGLWVVPLGWVVVGTYTAFFFGFKEDLAFPAAGLLALVYFFLNRAESDPA